MEKSSEQLWKTRFLLRFEISRAFLRAKQVGEKRGKFKNPTKNNGLQKFSNIFFPLVHSIPAKILGLQFISSICVDTFYHPNITRNGSIV